MIHAGDITLLDYNRTGTPLLEIVTQPDLEVGEEAEVFLQQLRRMVRYLGVCDGNMEEGSLRCDANVSVNLEGQGLGSKVEVKNLNSFKFVRKAITFEIERQTEILEPGRRGHAGDPAVERKSRRHGEHAHQGELLRLPLLPRARPAALCAWCGFPPRGRERPRGAPGGPQAAVHRHPRALGGPGGFPLRGKGDGRLLRGSGEARRGCRRARPFGWPPT